MKELGNGVADLAQNHADILEAFLTGISYRFFCWLKNHQEVFVDHKAERGFVWG